jgi:hypothetical protein
MGGDAWEIGMTIGGAKWGGKERKKERRASHFLKGLVVLL